MNKQLTKRQRGIMKKFISIFICVVMLFTCSASVFAYFDNRITTESIENIIAEQAKNNPDDFDENGVRKSKEGKLTGNTAKRSFITNFETGKQESFSVGYNICFDKLYGFAEVNEYTSVAVVESGSSMTIEFTENSQYAEHPLFSDKATLSEDGTKWSTAYSGKNPLDLEIYSNNNNYVSNDKNIFHKDGENTYRYEIQDGMNIYSFKTVYLPYSYSGSELLKSQIVLGLSKEDIDRLKETKTLSLNTASKYGMYTYAVEPVYELLFGEKISTPDGVAQTQEYTTKADIEYVYNPETKIYDKRVDNNIELTFDECYGVIQIDTASYTAGRIGTLRAERAGIDPIIEIPVVKANSKMHIKLPDNSQYDTENYNKDNYTLTGNEESWQMPSRRKYWRYFEAYSNNSNDGAEISVSGGGSVMIFEDSGTSYDYVSNKEMWYSIDEGLNDYVMNYAEDIEAFIPLKFVLALNDEQLWELKQFNTVSNHISSHIWTYSFDGLYEVVFNETAPPTEIADVSANMDTDNNNISVSVDASCTRGKSLFAVSYKNGAIVDTDKVVGGTATLEGSADKVKVFCWKSLESMIPLCPIGEATVQ